MGPRRTLLLASLLVVALALAWAGGALLEPPAWAQSTQPPPVTPGSGATGETQPAVATAIPGTPTVTRTPTLTPTATSTLTALGAELVLAKAYLDGGDYAKAADGFAKVASVDRGNAEALAGLKAALEKQARATATAGAPSPTPQATPATPTPASNVAGSFAEKWSDFGGTALAALAVVLLVYVLARVLRWLFSWAREWWFTRGRPIFHRPPTRPGFVLGDFVNATGDAGFEGARIVAQAITQQLVGWNEAVQDELKNPLQIDGLASAGLAGFAAVWSQVFPPQRAYKATGILLGRPPGPYQLALERRDLRSNNVDASHAFEGTGDSPAQAFRELAMTAAFWLRDPSGTESAPALMETQTPVRKLTGAPETPPEPTPVQYAGEALKRLAVVRRQVNQGAVDHTTASRTLDEAQAGVDKLPAGSGLRRDLQSALDDLRRIVQPGRVGS